MFIYFIITYLVIGLSVNFGVSKLDKIEILDDLDETDEPLNPHLIILFWPILFASFCYYFFKT